MRWWRGAIPADGARRPAQDGGGPRTGRRAVRGWPTVTGQRSSPRRARWRAADRRGRLADRGDRRCVRLRSVSSKSGSEQPAPARRTARPRTVAELLEMSVGMREHRAPERATRLLRRCRALLGSSQAGAATDNDGAEHASPAAHASRRCSHVSSTMSPERWPMCNVTPSRGLSSTSRRARAAISSGTTVESATSPSSTSQTAPFSARRGRRRAAAESRPGLQAR